MRFAAAVEAGNPDARLFGAAAQVAQKRVEDGLHPFRILTIAHEGLQFIAQHPQGGFGDLFGDLGHAIVQQSVTRRLLEVDLPIQHE